MYGRAHSCRRRPVKEGKMAKKPLGTSVLSHRDRWMGVGPLWSLGTHNQALQNPSEHESPKRILSPSNHSASPPLRKMPTTTALETKLAPHHQRVWCTQPCRVRASKIIDVVALERPALNVDPGFLDVPPHHPCPQLFVGYQVLWGQHVEECRRKDLL